jgi:hypothetical protein
MFLLLPGACLPVGREWLFERYEQKVEVVVIFFNHADHPVIVQIILYFKNYYVWTLTPLLAGRGKFVLLT